MIERDEAFAAAGLLAGGIPGFSDDAIEVFVDQLMNNTDDGGALIQICTEMSLSWTGKMRPSLHDVLSAYHEHPAVREAREARLAEGRLAAIGSTPWCQGTGWIPDVSSEHPDWLRPCPRCNPVLDEVFRDPDKWERYLAGEPLAHLAEVVKGYVPPPSCKLETHHDPHRIVPWAEGQAIMNDAYRSLWGRDIGAAATPDPELAELTINTLGHQSRDGKWRCSFVKVLEAFNDDQRRVRASLDALGRRLTDEDYGRTLVLGPPPEPLYGLQQPRTPPVAVPDTPRPADGPTEVDERLMADALAETARLLGERP